MNNAFDIILPVDEELETAESEGVERDQLAERFAGRDLNLLVPSAASFLKRRELELHAAKARLEPLIDQLQKEIKFFEERVTYAENCLMALLPPGPDSAVVTDMVSVYYSPSFETKVYDPAAVPVEFLRFTDPQPDKTKIKKALESGEEVPGAQLGINYNLRIGAGGARGAKNQQQRENKRREIKV